MVLFVLMSAVGATLSTTLFHRSYTRSAKEADLAYIVAEAGADVALFEVQLETDFGGDGIGRATGALGEGTYEVQIEPEYGGPGAYTIRSICEVHGIRRGVELNLDVETGGGGMFFGRDSVRLSGGYTDSYSSAAGPYASQLSGGHAGEQGSVKSNADIELSGSATVWGDATPGPTGTVIGDTSNVHGSTAPATQPFTPDPYTYAPPIASMGVHSGTKVFTAGTYRYTQFTVSAGKVATFVGDVELYVDGKFTISGSGMGIVAPGAKVVIHHGANDFTASGGSIVNTAQLPSSLEVYSASTTKVTISGSADFFGRVHAPEANFISSGGSGLYGSVLARTITVSGGASLHADGELGGGEGGVIVRLVRPIRP